MTDTPDPVEAMLAQVSLETTLFAPNSRYYGLETTVITQDGRTYSGIIAAESAGSVTLRKAEGKEDVVLRSQIETLSSTGLSLMPEGMEKDLDKQQIADVIALEAIAHRLRVER